MKKLEDEIMTGSYWLKVLGIMALLILALFVGGVLHSPILVLIVIGALIGIAINDHVKSVEKKERVKKRRI